MFLNTQFRILHDKFVKTVFKTGTLSFTVSNLVIKFKTNTFTKHLRLRKKVIFQTIQSDSLVNRR